MPILEDHHCLDISEQRVFQRKMPISHKSRRVPNLRQLVVRQYEMTMRDIGSCIHGKMNRPFGSRLPEGLAVSFSAAFSNARHRSSHDEVGVHRGTETRTPRFPVNAVIFLPEGQRVLA